MKIGKKRANEELEYNAKIGRRKDRAKNSCSPDKFDSCVRVLISLDAVRGIDATLQKSEHRVREHDETENYENENYLANVQKKTCRSIENK